MAHSPLLSNDSSDDELVVLAPASVIQSISIRQHVPVVLDMDEGNYGQWRCFFESVLGKFGLTSHVRSSTPYRDHPGEWRMVDYCIAN
jgi:hypothetical protein